MSIPQNAPPPTPPQQSLSFTQGFLLGQLSVVVLIGAFIKFFIFGEPPSPEVNASARALARRNISHTHRRRSISINSSFTNHRGHNQNLHTKQSSSILRNPTPLTTAAILSKTYYNVNSHQPESLDWFNVLIAQTIAQFRNDAHHDDAILTSLTSVLNGAYKPDFLDSIAVTEISLGEDFPIFSNCRVHPVDDDGGAVGGSEQGRRLQARMDVDLSDFITLGVETKIVLNYPKPFTAILPIALSVSVVRFSGTLSISFLPSSSPSTSSPHSASPTTLAFSFLPDYRLSLSTRSLLGSRSRLQDVPKIAQLVESRLHAWFDERCVEPRMQQVVLPSLWPRMGRMKVGQHQQQQGGGEADEGSGWEGRVDERAEGPREEYHEESGEGLRRRGGYSGTAAAAAAVGGRDEAGARLAVPVPGAMPGMMVS